ncbi:MAG: hypothetical protein WBK37_05070 [Kiritimatiellia bacterium]
MKKLWKILIGILVVLAIVAVVLELSLDKVVLKATNAAGPQLLGVPVSLAKADISLFRGKAALGGLHVGNPEGFKTDGLLDLGSVAVRLDNKSLLSDTIVIKEITIDGLVVTYEQGLRGSNLGALIESLSGEEKEAEEKPEAEEKAGEEKPAKKVIIEKLSITGSRLNFSLTGAAALTGGGAVPIPLPPITLTDLGKDKDGATLLETIQSVLQALRARRDRPLAARGICWAMVCRPSAERRWIPARPWAARQWTRGKRSVAWQPTPARPLAGRRWMRARPWAIR